MDEDSDFVVTVGLMLDATSKLTKVTREWEDLQRGLVKSVGGGMVELKGSKLYEGAGKWKTLPKDRHEVIDELITWLCDSGFKIAIAAVNKSVDLDDTLAPVTSHELLAAFHVALQVQKANQGKKRNKGVTFLVLDESKVRDSLIALISDPPAWADAYYRRGKKAEAFDTLIHTPFFVRSEDIALVQLADLVAYIYCASSISRLVARPSTVRASGSASGRRISMDGCSRLALATRRTRPRTRPRRSPVPHHRS